VETYFIDADNLINLKMSNGFMKCLIFLLQILKDKMIPSIDVTTYFHDANMVFKQKKKTIITIKMGMIQVC
jgi:hypothetical protein